MNTNRKAAQVIGWIALTAFLTFVPSSTVMIAVTDNWWLLVPASIFMLLSLVTLFGCLVGISVVGIIAATKALRRDTVVSP